MLLRAGSIKGLSVGFQPLEQSTTPTGIRYDRAELAELSVVAHPAYQPAAVTAVREEETPMSETVTTAEDPRVDALTRQVDDLTDRLSEAVNRMSPQEQAKTLGVIDGFALSLRDLAQHRHTRALADVVSGSNAGVLPPEWSNQVIRYVDARRPLIAASGKMGFPTSGHTLTLPKMAQEALVGARGTEKTQVPTRALQTVSETFTAEWYAGAVDVAMELIAQSDPSIVTLVVQSLLDQYAVATEVAHITNAEAAGSDAGALDVATYGGLVGDLIVGSNSVREATGRPGDMLAVNTDKWAAILGLVDSDNRRVFATNGATNADGSASLTAEAINIGGIQVFHCPNLGQDTTPGLGLQFNTASLQIAEKPPMQVSQDNVSLMGRDYGVLGAIISMDPYGSAAVLKYTA
jgi:HK97 family phage major capsid protein